VGARLQCGQEKRRMRRPSGKEGRTGGGERGTGEFGKATSMRSRWTELASRIGAFGKSDEALLTFETISTLYTHPPRAYHNLSHIEHCLGVFDGVRMLAEERDCVEFALWMHDCVYIAERPDNESRSADAAGMVAGLLGCEAGFAGRARELIMVTRHNAAPARGDQSLIADIDLSVLGAEPGEYEIYRLTIREEFAFASDEQFRVGRLAFLDRMLERDALYSTPYFRRELEWKARENLEMERAKLVRGV